jgi:putative aldouronate transport system substrate-binding protein
MYRDAQIRPLLCLAALIALFGLADISAQPNSVAGKQSTPLIFSILYNEKDAVPLRKDWLVLSEIAARKNIKFKITTGSDANYLPAIKSALNSSDPPDIILKVWPQTIVPFAAAGQLLPINQYEYLMPNYSRYIKANGLKEEIDKLRDEKGNYYVLPGYQREIQVQEWVFRRDIFKAEKLPEPKTYDDMYASLLSLKRKYPNSWPITATYGGAHLFAMMGAGYGISAGWNGNRMYDEKSNSWLYAPATKNWREMYQFLHKCYAAGLLDPEIFTQDPNAFVKKLTDGTSFIAVTWISSGFSVWNKALESAGISGGDWAPLMAPQSTVGVKALPAVDKFRKGTSISANAISKPYFKELLTFLDWIYYSEEGETLAAWGKEDITYSINNSEKSYLPTIKTAKNPKGFLDPSVDFGLNAIFDLCEVSDFEDSKKPAEIVAFLNTVLASKLTAKPYPSLALSGGDQDAISILSNDLDAYVNEMIKNFIKGESDIEADWESYIANLEKKGYKTLQAIWNNAWKMQR